MRVRCAICPHRCGLEEGETGLCRARMNRGGRVVCSNYGQVTSLALDPVKKKPLAHFHPGGNILSTGSFGCNLRCPFCQNREISAAGEGESSTRTMTPTKLAELAMILQGEGNIGLAYTYNEPLVGIEFVRDCAEEIRGRGMLNVVVTNGMVCPGPWKKLLPLLDAVNIDLKGFSQKFYDKVGGSFAAVKKSILLAVEAGVHVEVTTLVVPGWNDAPEEMAEEAEWLAGLDVNLPLHITRYFPQMNFCEPPATPLETLRNLVKVASARLKRVRAGNC